MAEFYCGSCRDIKRIEVRHSLGLKNRDKLIGVLICKCGFANSFKMDGNILTEAPPPQEKKSTI